MHILIIPFKTKGYIHVDEQIFITNGFNESFNLTDDNSCYTEMCIMLNIPMNVETLLQWIEGRYNNIMEEHFKYYKFKYQIKPIIEARDKVLPKLKKIENKFFEVEIV